MISKEEVVHIAKLARLELTEQEIEKMQKDLSAILDYFELLKKAPKDKIRPAIRPGFPSNDGANLRKDEARRSNIEAKIIEAAPDKKDGYIKVKAIL